MTHHLADDTLRPLLIRYLQTGRDALLWKLEGTSEYDARRPLTPTGTNLLGLVKHVASLEAWYLGDCVGRPFGEPFPWFERDAEPNADMWATAEETREQFVDLYRRAWTHADATLETLPLGAPARVPWWPAERRDTTLVHLVVHVIAETHRHAGHADVVRELVDGSAGMLPGRENLPEQDEAWWQDHRERLERTAREAGEST